MTRLEFTTRTEAQSRRYNRYLTVWFGLSIAGLGSGKFFDKGDPNSPIYVALVVLFVASILWLAWYWRRLPRKFGLLCPHCGRALTDAHGRLAQLTGNCPHCRQAVFDDASPPRSGKEVKITRQEFVTSLAALAHKTRRHQTWVTTLGLCLLAAGVPFAIHMNTLADEGRLNWTDSAGWMGIVVGVVGVLPLLLMGLAVFMVTGKRNRTGVPCPECTRPLGGPSARVATETGMCVYCGGKIFEPTAEPG